MMILTRQEQEMASSVLAKQGERRREQMVKFIRSYAKKNGFSPTMVEIGDAVGIASPNAVRNHLFKLQEEGRIKMSPRTARSIQVLDG